VSTFDLDPLREIEQRKPRQTQPGDSHSHQGPCALPRQTTAASFHGKTKKVTLRR